MLASSRHSIVPTRASQLSGPLEHPMKPSESVFVDIRGLRYHCRTWGDPAHPKLFLLHGWMDVSASFQFFVDALRGDWHAIAPDWRGYGLTRVERGGQLLVSRLPCRSRCAVGPVLPGPGGEPARAQHGRERRESLRRHPAGARREAGEPRGIRAARQRRRLKRRHASRAGSRSWTRRSASGTTRASTSSPRGCGTRTRGSRPSVRSSSRTTGACPRRTGASGCAAIRRTSA